MKPNFLLTMALVLLAAPLPAGTGVSESLGNLFGRERTNLYAQRAADWKEVFVD